MNSDTVETLKLKLKSAIKQKMYNERLLYSLYNTERILNKEQCTFKLESELMSEQIEGVKNQIAQMKYQIEMIGVCNISEKSKIDNHIANLNIHKGGFDNLFAEEHRKFEKYNKEKQKKENEKHELEKLQQAKVTEKNEQLAGEAAAIERECETIERECTVLAVNQHYLNTSGPPRLRAKRNNAIMLKLRRKLVEAEDTRRQLMKTCNVDASNANEN